MGWELMGVVEAENGRERERVEKQRPAMTMWREGEGRRAQELPGNCREGHTWLLPGNRGVELKQNPNTVG